MKKYTKLIALFLIALITLTGCSTQATSFVSGGDDVIATIKDESLTKENIYNFIKVKYGTSLIASNLMDMQLDKLVDFTDEDMKEAQALLETAKENFDGQFETLILASGYANEEEYLNGYIIKNLKVEKMLTQYFNENIASITKTLSTRKLKSLVAETKADAEAALEALKAVDNLDAAAFVTVAEQYGTAEDEKKVVGESVYEHVYDGRTTQTYLNDRLSSAKAGLLNEVIMDGNTYKVLFFEENDLENEADKILASINVGDLLKSQLIQSMYSYNSNVGNFEIYDVQMNDLFHENNPFTAQ
ncbi:MAG: hypothetical protein GX760_03315 [Erysipelothrix sp.]|nr:hypothetical protein [Erysipelothrix sp.]